MSDLKQIAAEVRTWLEANFDPSLSLREWREILVDSGWGAPDFPTEYYGRGLDASAVATVNAEFARVGAVGTASTGPRLLAAVTLLAHGDHEQKRKYLRGVLTGQDAWCQLFSEPGSGSDLAGSTTRADKDGDRWIVNGQKVWTTSAHHADFGLLVARTDWEVPKHQGLSYFVLEMNQPGVEVRQLKQMNGHASFNEVFFTDAVVQPGNLVGKEGEGWAVALTTLAHERSSFARMRGGQQVEGRKGRVYDEYAEELAISNEPYVWYPQRAGRVDLIVERAQQTGAIHDAVIRQDIAGALAISKCANWFSMQSQAAKRGGATGSITKLAASRLAQACARVHTSISGPEAMYEGESSAHQGIIAEVLLSTPAVSIAGGTDEIQRNIISERILEMPKETRFDGGPFKDVPRNA
ncbi:MAG: acyl-CoA dehydrogenase family protein, partial [Pseudomonadales bacterium]|nr:acyl-CoA dehydrogenase family protein [Pseudomonadales bacterium]